MVRSGKASVRQPLCSTAGKIGWFSCPPRVPPPTAPDADEGGEGHGQHSLASVLARRSTINPRPNKAVQQWRGAMEPWHGAMAVSAYGMEPSAVSAYYYSDYGEPLLYR